MGWCPQKRPENSLTPFLPSRDTKRSQPGQAEGLTRIQPCWLTYLELPASRTMSNSCSFLSHPVCGSLLCCLSSLRHTVTHKTEGAQGTLDQSAQVALHQDSRCLALRKQAQRNKVITCHQGGSEPCHSKWGTSVKSGG